MTVVGEHPAASPTEPTSQSLAARLSTRFPRAIPMLVLTSLVLVLNPLHVRAYTKISPFDEYAHIDSVIRGSRGQVLVQPDDKLLQETLDEVACREGDMTGFPLCREGDYDATEFVYKGWNQASSHTPYYYVLTGLAARVLRAPPPDDSIVTWARLLGAAWLLLGMYLVLRAGDELGVARLPLVLALVVVAAAPAVLHATTTVNPDAAGFVGGAAVLLSALVWERGRSLWVLALAAFVCASLDTTNVMAVMVVVAYFAIRALASYRGVAGETIRRPWTAYVRAGGVATGASFVAIFGWKLVYNLLAHDVDLSGHPTRVAFHVDQLDVTMVLGRDTLLGIFPPIEGYLPQVLTTAPYDVFAGVAAFFVIGVLIASVIRFDLADRLSTLGVATLVALVVSSPVLVIYNYLSDGLYYPILTRQALAALPYIAVVTAGTAERGVARALLLVVAGGLYVSAVVALV